MPVRSKRLWGPTVVGTGPVTLYTCPADETAIVKTLSYVNNAALSNLVVLRLNGNTNAVAVDRVTLAGNEAIVRDSLFLVLHPGDVLSAIGTQASAVLTGSGAELEGVAD